jgi:hypothetical protein
MKRVLNLSAAIAIATTTGFLLSPFFMLLVEGFNAKNSILRLILAVFIKTVLSLSLAFLWLTLARYSATIFDVLLITLSFALINEIPPLANILLNPLPLPFLTVMYKDILAMFLYFLFGFVFGLIVQRLSNLYER